MGLCKGWKSYPVLWGFIRSLLNQPSKIECNKVCSLLKCWVATLVGRENKQEQNSERNYRRFLNRTIQQILEFIWWRLAIYQTYSSWMICLRDPYSMKLPWTYIFLKSYFLKSHFSCEASNRHQISNRGFTLSQSLKIILSSASQVAIFFPSWRPCQVPERLFR